MYFIWSDTWLYSILGRFSCIFSVYDLYAIFAILIDLIFKKWVFTCIETHIFVASFSIYHVFISIIKFLYCFLLLGKLFTLIIQHSKTCNQHNLYTIFDKIPSLSWVIFFHTWLQCGPLTTTKGVLSCIFQAKRISSLV